MTGEQVVEQRSSVKVTLNAKGDPQIEVKSYAGTDTESLQAAATQALNVFDDTVRRARANMQRANADALKASVQTKAA